MIRYKMLVLDLDGTLTNGQKEITSRTKDVLIKIQKQGVRVVLASGRPVGGITTLAEELELGNYNGYILAFNGGKIIDCTTNSVLFEQTLEEKIIPSLYKEAMDFELSILTYKGDKILATSSTDDYVQLEASINKMPIVQSIDFLSEIELPINKCLIVGDPPRLQNLEQSLTEKLKGKVSAYRSADYFLECVPLGIDKARSIQYLINILGIRQAEIVACGDSYNDLSMIEFAGLGVAMDNAVLEVKEKADFITLSSDEEGVAYLVESLWKI